MIFNVEDVVEIKRLIISIYLNCIMVRLLAFKDIALQVIGLMYEALELNKKINIIVATSGDTGSAAIAALKRKKKYKPFCITPTKKISNIQRKIMTTCNSNNILILL